MHLRRCLLHTSDVLGPYRPPVTMYSSHSRLHDVLGGDRKAASAISRLRPATRSVGASMYSIRKVNNSVVSMDSPLLATSNRLTTPLREAANEKVPWQLIAWLEAGIVSAASKVQGGTDLRRLQEQHKALVSYDERPYSSMQPSLASILAETTQWMAEMAFGRSAMALSWHMLSEVNGLNEAPGLALENLHSSLQELAYDVLQSLGCATAWATPIHRALPAAAAGLVPGTIGKISLQQCLELDCHTPAACFEHYDGSWDGDCTVYLPLYQLVPVTELGKALDQEKVLQYLGNSRSKSLRELLLLQFHKGMLAVSPQAMLTVQNDKQQQQQHQVGTTDAAAMAAGRHDDTSYSTESCASGGGIGHRGRITAIGANDDDGVAPDVAVVPAGLNRQKRDRRAFLVSPLVIGSTVVSSGSNNGSKASGKQGVLRRLGSALKRFCSRSSRA